MSVFLNGNFIDEADATLQINDLSIQRGYAAFDYLRTIQGKPLFLNDHLSRFTASLKAMHLQLPYTEAKIAEIIQELVTREGEMQTGVRMIVTGGYSADAYNLVTPNIIISCKPIHLPTQQDFDRGINIITYPHQRELPSVKSTNYLMAVWLQPLLKEKGVHDVLYYAQNSVTEFPRANVFMVTTAGKLVTPSNNILAGITRKRILDLAPKIVDVEVRDVQLEEFCTAQEIFMTSTTKRIIPVVEMDGKKIGDGKPGIITRKLYETLLEVEANM